MVCMYWGVVGVVGWGGGVGVLLFFFFKQKTAYEIYQCDWSSDVCSSDLFLRVLPRCRFRKRVGEHFQACDDGGVPGSVSYPCDVNAAGRCPPPCPAVRLHRLERFRTRRYGERGGQSLEYSHQVPIPRRRLRRVIIVQRQLIVSPVLPAGSRGYLSASPPTMNGTSSLLV